MGDLFLVLNSASSIDKEEKRNFRIQEAYIVQCLTDNKQEDEHDHPQECKMVQSSHLLTEGESATKPDRAVSHKVISSQGTKCLLMNFEVQKKEENLTSPRVIIVC